MKRLFIAVTLFVAATVHASPATLVGDEIDAAMIRTVDTGYGLGRINGYGLDAPFVVQDGSADQQDYSSTFKLDVDGGGFSIRFLSSAAWQTGILFRLSDLDFLPAGSALASVNVDTNLVGYTMTVGTDWIDLGLGGTHFTPSTYFVGTFDVSTVPTPASLPLIALALLSFRLLRRKPGTSESA